MAVYHCTRLPHWLELVSQMEADRDPVPARSHLWSGGMRAREGMLRPDIAGAFNLATMVA